MTAEPGSVREAAERTARAVMTGNLPQLMADLTPTALGQMMQMGAAGGGGFSPATMPAIQGFELAELGTEGETHRIQVTFRSEAGRATLNTDWQQIMGQWKVTGLAVVSLEQTGTEPGA